MTSCINFYRRAHVKLKYRPPLKFNASTITTLPVVYGAFRLRYATEADLARVAEFLADTDNDYYPKLSNRRGGILGFIAKLLCRNGKIILCERNSECVGTFGYWFEGDRTAWLHWLGVRNWRSNPFVAYKLTRYAVESERKTSVLKISTRTWSTNEQCIKVLKALGFKKVSEIKGDEVVDRTSFFYEASWKPIEKYFQQLSRK